MRRSLPADPRQLLLFDLPPSGRRPSRRGRHRDLPHNVFFALRPPPEDAASIHRFALDLSRPRGDPRPLPPERLHLSLNGAGSFAVIPHQTMALAMSAAALVRAPCFDIRLDRIMSFGRNRPYPVVLCSSAGMPEFKALQAAVRLVMAQAGLASHAPATPHLTLWYGERPLPQQELAQPFGWTVTAFWLVHSFVGQGRHEWPAHWPLGDGIPPAGDP